MILRSYEMNFKAGLKELLDAHKKVFVNPSREMLIHKSVTKEKVFVTKNGALAVWTPAESTGRSPKDTFIVKNSKTEKTVDWTSPNNLPVSQETFDMLFEDAVAALSKKDSLFVTDRVIGADASYALPIRTITDRAFTSLFADNMFRAVPEGIEKSVLFDKKFTLLVVPYDKLDEKKYRNRIRMINENKSSDMAIVMDFENSMGVVFGSAYLGSCKKLMFTVMNYYLPECGILPLHCSANEGADGVSALMLGLSGTGKTTLSADPARKLIGDDEHGWNDNGIANFENGCYAKLINLNKEKEPEIYNAVFHEADYMEHGAMIENCMIYPDGKIDFDDERYTANSRASYPLRFLSNIKESSVSSHPSTIIFLTADANGVLPPVAKLTKEQAMLWFLMGYTSKLAGTETGIVEPVSTFSRFFGAPFMPRNPDDYSELLGKKMDRHGVNVYLVNTGWSGGAYGTGKRMDINITRAIVSAAISGELEKSEYTEDKLFHVMIPKSCPGVESSILDPINTWSDKEAFKARAEKLAAEFSKQFDKAYGHNTNLSESLKRQCPGK